MIITSWNCHNLNTRCKVENRRNRKDYLAILKTAIGAVPDVAFFCEIEPEPGDVSFHACSEFDSDWDLSSGISLKVGPGVKVGKKDIQLLLPSGISREYGMALWVEVSKDKENQEIVFFWNLKRKYVKGKKKTIHGYPATWEQLVRTLGGLEGDFWNSSAIIMGDFNLTGEEIRRKMEGLNTPMKVQLDRVTHFPEFPVTDPSAGRPLDHYICRDGKAVCLENIMFDKLGVFVGKGLSDHLPVIIRTVN